MNTTNNARFQSTHTLIKSVFLELCQHSSAEKISVREICEKAQINRSSFYLHFADIYTLMDELNRDMTEQIKYIMIQSFNTDSVSMKQTFIKLFQFLSDNQSFFSSIYRNRRSSVRDLNITLDEPFRSRIITAGRFFGFESEQEIRYHSLFFFAGFSAIVEEWLLNGCRESPEYLSEMLYREYRRV